jgi:predicted phosphodiesterase
MSNNIIHKKLTIFGDLHGKYGDFHKIIKKKRPEYILQVGDCGFSYKELERYSPEKMKFIPGNHDNYDICISSPYCLGDYGNYSLGGLDFFFIRGAFSIDWKDRLNREMLGMGRSFWPDEQLDYKQMEDCFNKYKADKPKIVVTHSCPRSISKLIGNPAILASYGYDPEFFTTGTQELLQSCLEVHQPDVWIFGHFHRTLDFVLENTRFICLGELRYIDYQNGTFTNSNILDSINNAD